MDEEDQQQAIATSDFGSLARSFSDIEVSSEIISAFQRMSEGQRLLGSCLQASRSQRDLPPYSLADLLVKIEDWQRPLAGIQPYALQYCFDKALEVHGDGPFQVGNVARIWREMSETTKQQLFTRSVAGKALTGPPCEFCNGTNIMYRDKNGAALKWAEIGFGVGVSRCNHTTEGE